jgi:DNA-binding NarL/FixJ family response regulator
LLEETSNYESKVLIVDDSNVVRDRIAKMLSGITGVEIVGTAADSIYTIYLVDKLKPDAVILDIRIIRIHLIPRRLFDFHYPKHKKLRLLFIICWDRLLTLLLIIIFTMPGNDNWAAIHKMVVLK